LVWKVTICYQIDEHFCGIGGMVFDAWRHGSYEHGAFELLQDSPEMFVVSPF